MTKKIIIVLIISLVITFASFFINNAEQCCDQNLFYGWPFSFYGGGGGILGTINNPNRILVSGLFGDLIFWFVVIFIFQFMYKIYGTRVSY